MYFEFDNALCCVGLKKMSINLTGNVLAEIYQHIFPFFLQCTLGPKVLTRIEPEIPHIDR